ncbi:hypothetical protein CW705_06405 [Candidatus Bathyarchaeota archaeon]|nr:MAG: hypothetical protein CW705_06405 [Candidatus Bathyarchaeota archaeon]
MISCRCVMRGFGKGVLEFSGEILTFYAIKGLIRKKRITVKRLSLSEIIDVKSSASELVVFWKRQDIVEDVFIADEGQRKDLNRLSAALGKALREYKWREREKAEMEERRREEIRKKIESYRERIAQTFANVTKIIDLLFEVLKSLESRTKWNIAEECVERSMSIAKALQRNVPALSLDFTKLSLAVRGRYRKETIDESYNILSHLYNQLVNTSLIERDEEIRDLHLNLPDLKDLITAYYILNDILLGLIVEDEDVQREIDYFLELVQKIEVDRRLNLEIGEIRELANKILVRNEKENVIANLKNLLLATISQDSNSSMIDLLEGASF